MADDSTFDLIVSLEDAVTLKKVREMKDSKIDHFIDEELNGHIKDQACEDVIDFLKTDIRLIDLILNINVTSKHDIECQIRKIVDFVNAAEEPKHSKIYLNALDQDEKDLEAEYNMVLTRLDNVIQQRFKHVMDGASSAFFQ